MSAPLPAPLLVLVALALVKDFGEERGNIRVTRTQGSLRSLLPIAANPGLRDGTPSGFGTGEPFRCIRNPLFNHTISFRLCQNDAVEMRFSLVFYLCSLRSKGARPHPGLLPREKGRRCGQARFVMAPGGSSAGGRSTKKRTKGTESFRLSGRPRDLRSG